MSFRFLVSWLSIHARSKKMKGLSAVAWHAEAVSACLAHDLPVYRVYHRLSALTGTVALFERHVCPACKPFTFSTHIIILLYHPLPNMLCSITPFRFWFHTDLGQVKLRVDQLSKCHIGFGMHPRFDSAIRRPYHFFYHGLSAVLAFHLITLQVLLPQWTGAQKRCESFLTVRVVSASVRLQSTVRSPSRSSPRESAATCPPAACPAARLPQAH